MTIVAFVPAKGTSERVPRKNLAIFDGEHLFRRKLRQALACPHIDEVCLDTESDEIAQLAADLPVSVLKRPKHLASNAADGHDMFAWACRQRPDADIWLQVLCTAPFVTAATISRAIEALLAAPNADSLVAVSRAQQYCWHGEAPGYGRGHIPNSADLPEQVIEAMSLYIVRRPATGLPAQRFGQSPILFDLDPVEQIDINSPADMKLAETLATGQRASETLRFRAIAPQLSSSLLADICKEQGINGVLPAGIGPTSIAGSACGRLLGRAKTLQLAAVDPNNTEDWKGIYGALKSYEFIRQGDVIMVANEVPEYAYFGDLNARLAIRAGAIGAIIDGMTRDTSEVRALGFPVHARGSRCDDIKFEGTVQSMSQPIRIGQVEIANGDVVSADEDGVVVIPAARWPAVETAALEVAGKEASIRLAAAQGCDASDILETHGAF